MITIHLRTNSYEEFFQACDAAGLTHDGAIITTSHNHHIDIIGELRRPTGNILTDIDGNGYPETVLLEGYHVNLRAKEPIGIEHLAIEVVNPLRVFA